MQKTWILSIAAMVSLWMSPLMLIPSEAQSALPPEVAKHGYADMIVVNGKLVSVDDAGYNGRPGSIFDAMAIKGNRIVALGTNERIRTLADSNTTVIDVEGQTVIPGIVESHVHIFGDPVLAAQMGLRIPDKGVNVRVKAGRDIESTRLIVENAIRAALPKVQPGEWVRVDILANPEERVSRSHVFSWVTLGNFEPRERLDRLAQDNPVMVQVASRATVNTKAWELMKEYFPALDDYYKVTLADAPDAPEKGLIGVEGMVSLQWEVWWRDQPLTLLADMMRRTLDIAAAHGITTFSSRLTHPKLMDTYTLLNREGQMPIRFAALMEGHRRPRDPDTIRQFYEMTGNLTNVGNDRFWINGVATELWDSSFPQACLGPDVPAPPEIKRREMCPGPGKLYYDTLKNAMKAGWRLAGIHGVGSHGVRLFIQMAEDAMRESGRPVEDLRKLRLTVEHAEALGNQPDVIAGLKKYGIIVSVHPPRLFREPDYVRDYGPEVQKFMQPIKSWLDQGVKVVGQMERYRNVGYIWTIPMTRRIIDGKVVLPEEAIDRVTVLKMWTKWASEYVMKEDDLGSLELGKLADFVVLDQDYLTIPIEQIPDIRPQMTVVGGKIEHLEAGFARNLGLEPAGYQFPDDYEPWGEYVPEY
ncbi:MAG: amidohydrolase family protein [Acidobacteriota bacterium]